MTYSPEELERMGSSLNVQANLISDELCNIIMDDDRFIMYDVNVRNRDGDIYEHHCKVGVPYKYETINGIKEKGRLDQMGGNYQSHGLIMPSFALHGAVMEKLYLDGLDMNKNKNHGCMERIIDTLRDEDFPFHPYMPKVTNTIIDYGMGAIYHYPFKDQWPMGFEITFNVGGIDYVKQPFNEDEVRNGYLPYGNLEEKKVMAGFMSDLFGIANSSALYDKLNNLCNYYTKVEAPIKDWFTDHNSKLMMPLLIKGDHIEPIEERVLSLHGGGKYKGCAPYLEKLEMKRKCSTCGDKE